MISLLTTLTRIDRADYDARARSILAIIANGFRQASTKG